MTALFKIAGHGSPEISIYKGMDKDELVHAYNRLLLSLNEEWNHISCRDVDRLRRCHVHEGKLKKGKKHHILTHICEI